MNATSQLVLCLARIILIFLLALALALNHNGASCYGSPVIVNIPDLWSANYPGGKGLDVGSREVKIVAYPVSISGCSAILGDQHARIKLEANTDLSSLNPALLWKAIGTVVNDNGVPKLNASSVTDRIDWKPKTIVYIGDSLTDGLDAGSDSKTFREVLRSLLETEYGGHVTNIVRFGVTDSQLKGMEYPVVTYNGPWPDAVVIQDAVTVDSIFDDGTVTDPALVSITTNGTAINGVTVTRPGAGYRVNDPVYFKKADNVSAEGRVLAVDSFGGITGLSLTVPGQYYYPGTAEVKLNSYPQIARRMVRDILTRWGTPHSRPLVFFLSCWKQGFQKFEYKERNLTWNQHLAGLWQEHEFINKVVAVDLDPVWQSPGATGMVRQASVPENGTTWTLNQPLGFDTADQNLYLIVPSLFSSPILSSAGDTIEVADASPLARSNVTVRIAQNVSWKTPGRFGDTYHPTNLGMSGIALRIFDAMRAEVEKAK